MKTSLMSSKFKRTVRSTLAAPCGVQNQKNREQGFEEPYAGWLILVGIIFKLIIIITVFTAVKLVIAQAGRPDSHSTTLNTTTDTITTATIASAVLSSKLLFAINKI